MAEFCPHLPIHHNPPTNSMEAYDNLTLLLCYAKSLFGVLRLGLEDDNEGFAEVAALGTYLCDEIRRRTEILYDMGKER